MRTDAEQDDIDRKSEARVDAVVTLFEDLTDREREDVIEKLRARWCLYCGGERPSGHSCQCQNDE